MAKILTLKRNYSISTFESGFRYSRNGGPPVISLYLWYQVYFVIIIVEFFVAVFWGWTVPEMDFLFIFIAAAKNKHPIVFLQYLSQFLYHTENLTQISVKYWKIFIM